MLCAMCTQIRGRGVGINGFFLKGFFKKGLIRVLGIGSGGKLL